MMSRNQFSKQCIKIYLEHGEFGGVWEVPCVNRAEVGQAGQIIYHVLEDIWQKDSLRK